tara:strand:- start:3 stop:416 length:414 start_codon:yes stop_codon:yes gene_type:complete
MITVAEQSSTVRLRIQLPTDTFNIYSNQALESGQDVEDLIQHRLRQCVNESTYTGRTLVINPETRQELESALGRSFSTGTELSSYITKSFQLAVGKIKVALAPELLRRIETRAIRKDFGEFLKDTVIKQLEHVVGLR